MAVGLCAHISSVADLDLKCDLFLDGKCEAENVISDERFQKFIDGVNKVNEGVEKYEDTACAGVSTGDGQYTFTLEFYHADKDPTLKFKDDAPTWFLVLIYAGIFCSICCPCVACCCAIFFFLRLRSDSDSDSSKGTKQPTKGTGVERSKAGVTPTCCASVLDGLSSSPW
eukprot:TRINITY_DN127082_c0_g1_i1.p1 TRINITY_DN127082_c0_g1~~TRINITY_DN127082_c0_g1_i1.p1  ORF type:complete len:183 (+),score=4.59 TRINITY_DN127082_c0_g1_i1:42-551(+)